MTEEREIYNEKEPIMEDINKIRTEAYEEAKMEGLSEQDAKNYAALKASLAKERAKKIMRNL